MIEPQRPDLEPPRSTPQPDTRGPAPQASGGGSGIEDTIRGVLGSIFGQN